MLPEQFTYTDVDRASWQNGLEDFVPEKVFDAHSHIWSEAHALPGTPDSLLRVPVDADELFAVSRQLFPNRQLAFMMLGTPVLDIDFAGHNRWLAAESQKYPDCFSAALCTPQMLPEEIIGTWQQLKYRALKPYLIYADNPGRSPISGLITEAQLEAANELGLMVVLHVDKAECLNDPENLQELSYFCGKYPHVVWLLAHCGRSFNSLLLENCIHKLKHLDHICYDLSAVCDPYSMYLLFKYEDTSRLMYGSDNIAAGMLRGTYASVNRGWKYVTDSNFSAPTYICFEQLHAMRKAALMAGLDGKALEDIFWNNAMRIYSRAPES